MSLRIVPVATDQLADRLSLVLRAGLAIKTTPAGVPNGMQAPSYDDVEGSPSDERQKRQRSDGTPLSALGYQGWGWVPPSPADELEMYALAKKAFANAQQAEEEAERSRVIAQQVAQQAVEEAVQLLAVAQHKASQLQALLAAIENVPMGNVLPINMPTAAENPDFENELNGKDVLNEMVTLMLNDKQIVGSYSGSVVLAGNGVARYSDWKAAGQKLALGLKLGEGKSNISFLVQADAIPDIVTDALPGVVLPRMVYRRTREDARYENDVPTARGAINELIVTGYASLTGLGPKLYGAYLVNRTELVNQNAKVDLHVLAEAWDGDLHMKLKKRVFDPSRFAQQLSSLLQKSRDNGFWHMDAKPPNMLYRGNDKEFTICWTDFDSNWCKIWPPNLRAGQGNCSILVHASLIMGYISCWMGPETYQHYLPAVQTRLIQDFNLDAGTDDAMCSWLDRLEVQEGRPQPSPPDGSNPFEEAARLRIANRLRLTMHQYLQPDGYRPEHRCILEANLEMPTFFQFFKFALAKETTEIRSWSNLRL